MSDYLSNLPVELIHKIFDDITMFDILGSLCLVNKRLRLISFGYSRFQVDFSYIKKKKQFDLFCDQLTSMSSQIVSLSFSDRDDATIPSKIEHFFLRFEVINDTFSNLKSLHLSHVDLTMWESIKHHVKSLVFLVSLFINVAYMLFVNEVSEFISYLLKDILFISTSLKYVYVKANNMSVQAPCLDFRKEQVSSIEHLTLLNIPIDLEQLYSLVPALRMLDVSLKVYSPAHQFRLNPSENLRRLSLDIYRLYFSTIEQLLHPMTRLTHLTITAYDVYYDMSDGAAWEPILTKIISFKFSFSFDKSTWIKKPITLDSFQSLFWLEKKRWYVGYDRCTVSGYSILYSIPYFRKFYPWHFMKGTIDTKSTGPQVLLLNNVNHFTVDEQLPTDYKCLRRLTNLEKLFINEPNKMFHVLFHNMVPHIDLSRITTLFIAQRCSKIDMNNFVRLISSMPHLHSLCASIVLLKYLFSSHWPNIRRLEIYGNSMGTTTTERSLIPNEIKTFYRSFTHIEYLSFYHDIDSNISILLNNIPTTISNIVIYNPVGITPADFPGFISYDWLKQNTCLRNFFYSCNKLNAVSLWF